MVRSWWLFSLRASSRSSRVSWFLLSLRMNLMAVSMSWRVSSSMSVWRSGYCYYLNWCSSPWDCTIWCMKLWLVNNVMIISQKASLNLAHLPPPTPPLLYTHPHFNSLPSSIASLIAMYLYAVPYFTMLYMDLIETRSDRMLIELRHSRSGSSSMCCSSFCLPRPGGFLVDLWGKLGDSCSEPDMPWDNSSNYCIFSERRL